MRTCIKIFRLSFVLALALSSYISLPIHAQSFNPGLDDAHSVTSVFIFQKNNWRDYCNAQQVSVLERNAEHIEMLAAKYPVRVETLQYILCYEFYDDNWYDKRQELWAKNRTLLPDSQPSLEFFWKTYQENKICESKGIKNTGPYGQKMNGSVHPALSTIGPQEMNITVALTMAIDGLIDNEDIVERFKDECGDWSLENVAYLLVSDEKASIEILAAYMTWAQDTYLEVANIDISGSLKSLLELHRMGNFKYYAQKRLKDKKLEDLPKGAFYSHEDKRIPTNQSKN